MSSRIDNMTSLDRAVVIGGSMAGLAAACVLSDHLREVILVERDQFGTVGEQRRGVPQGRHAHGLLAGGGQVLENLFPGLYSDLWSAGAVMCNITRDCHWCFEGGEHARFESDLEAVGVSRPLLEGIIRERVREISNVYIRDGCQVHGLIATSDNSRVTGIRMNDETLLADLVVDATGRGSHSPLWLEGLGYGKPKERRIEINLAYATRRFRRSPDHLNGALFVSIAPTPATGRGGFIAAQEGNSWIVTMNAYCGATVPTDLAGFIDFSKSLPASYIYDVISAAEPLGEPQAARFPASVRRRYECMNRFPAGYLVIGDAISSFNPVYAQGMSAAALQVAELSKALNEGRTRLAQRFFARAAKVVDTPWSIAAGNDLRMPEVAGSKSLMVRFLNWYVAKLHIGARNDPSLVTAFQNVTNLLASPSSLLKPPIIARVFLQAFCAGPQFRKPKQSVPAAQTP